MPPASSGLLKELFRKGVRTLLRRVVGKIFPRTLIEGYCGEFEKRNLNGSAPKL